MIIIWDFEIHSIAEEKKLIKVLPLSNLTFFQVWLKINPKPLYLLVRCRKKMIKE